MAQTIGTPTTSFIGRQDDIAAIKKAIATTPLVTVIGAAGSGKTRAAAVAAEELQATFPDGVWMVSYPHPVVDIPLVQRVAAQMGASLSLHNVALEALAAHVGPRRMLLLLDNCEYAIYECAILINLLIHRCPNLRVLTTSREPLMIEGEVLWMLRPLAQQDAATLLVDRAKRLNPQFAATSENAVVIEQICQYLDGLPLAIEMAAHQLALHSPAELAIAQGGWSNPQTRNQLNRLIPAHMFDTTLERSDALLTAGERLLWRRLAVFGGDFTLSAAESICSGGELSNERFLQVFVRLVDASIITVVNAAIHGRYRLLQPIRAYALERLRESDESAWLFRRHRDWYLALAEQAALGFKGGEQAEWRQRLAAEQKNIWTALQWCDEHGEAAKGLRFVVALDWYWYTMGYFNEGRWWLARMLVQVTEDGIVRGKALNAAGLFACWQGDYEEAIHLFHEGLDLWRRSGGEDSFGATIIGNMGMVARYQGDYETALTQCEESLAMHRQQRNVHGMAQPLHTLGQIAHDLGDYARAQRYCEESLARYQEVGDQVGGIGVCMTQAMIIAKLRGDHKSARLLYHECLAMQRNLGDQPGVALSLYRIGEALRCEGAHLWAKAAYEECLQSARALGDKRLITCALTGLRMMVGQQGADTPTLNGSVRFS